MEVKNITNTKYKTIEYYQELDKKQEMISLTYDAFYKSLFMKNKNILKKFLIDIFNLDLNASETTIFLDNVELPIDIKNEYKKKADILVTLNDKIIIDIEVNRSKYSDVKQRNTIYFGKLYGASLKEGEKATKAKAKLVYQLNLNAHEKDNKYGVDEYMYISKNTGEPLLENYKIFTRNLAFYRNMYYNENAKLTTSELWLVALTAKNFTELYEILSQILSPKKVEKFMEEVINLSQDKELFTSWERKMLDEIEEVTALENAQNEGREERNEEIARNLYDMDMPIDYISKATGLSEEKIKYCVASNAVEYKKSSSKLSTMDDTSLKND